MERGDGKGLSEMIFSKWLGSFIIQKTMLRLKFVRGIVELAIDALGSYSFSIKVRRLF